jgi:hypothetical protein
MYWHERCKADQLEKKSLKYLQIQDRPMSKPHNIWQSTGNDPISIKSGEIKSKLVTQSYMLQNIKARYNKNISSICTLCETGDESFSSILIEFFSFREIPRCFVHVLLLTLQSPMLTFLSLLVL